MQHEQTYSGRIGPCDVAYLSEPDSIEKRVYLKMRETVVQDATQCIQHTIRIAGLAPVLVW